MKFIKISFTVIMSILFVSCTDMLNNDNKTKITTSYIQSTPEGLERATAALYHLDRQLAMNGEGDLYAHLMFDGGTDIVLFRTGSAVQLNKLTLTATNNLVQTYWNNRYNIIGKANEIIAAAEAMGLEDASCAKSWAEAKVHRARCYFDLFRRFGRLYLNTEPTTIDNLDRDFKPASDDQVLSLIDNDLEDAMNVLDWTNNGEIGRMTKAVAMHVRAQVALWEKDWNKAIEMCEGIFSSGTYSYNSKSIDTFYGADLNSPEVILALPFSANTGGGGIINNGAVVGHRISMIGNAMYWSAAGLTYCSEYGGTAWGRFYPNTYLFSLYDKEKDKRYTEMFRHKWYYNIESELPAGKKIGDEVVPASKAEYLKSLHPQTMKYFDNWTNESELTRMSSYKDILVYRLAETYLIAAEAYMMKNGGSDAKALEYYNKSWVRAGNDEFKGTLTINDIVDEYARELCFEGTRWYLLKRLGLLEERVKLHYGDSTSEDPMLAANQIEARNAFVAPKHYNWPIPQSAIDNMGSDNFPQNEGW